MWRTIKQMLLIPLFDSALARVPCGRVSQVLGQREAVAMAPSLIRLILHIAMCANDDLLAY